MVNVNNCASERFLCSLFPFRKQKQIRLPSILFPLTVIESDIIILVITCIVHPLPLYALLCANPNPEGHKLRTNRDKTKNWTARLLYIVNAPQPILLYYHIVQSSIIIVFITNRGQSVKKEILFIKIL